MVRTSKSKSSFFISILSISIIVFSAIALVRTVVSRQNVLRNSEASGCCVGASSCGTQNTSASCNQAGCNWTCANSDGFVRRVGNKLVLNGQTYKFIGVNRDNAASDNASGRYDCGDGGHNPTLYLDTMFEHLKNRCSNSEANFVMRIWALQSYTQYNASTDTVDFTQMDRVIERAKRYGVRLIMTLENEWSDCTKPTTDGACPQDNYPNRKKNTWFGDDPDKPVGQDYGYKTWKAGVSPNFGYDYPLTYREYVRRIVTRYKDEPVILAWQLMNEAESEKISSSCQKTSDNASLYSFAQDMSSLIKSIDNNHLVSLGTIGNNNAGTAGTNYRNIHNLSTIDILETHAYGRPNSSTQTHHSSYVDTNLADAQSLNKPIFMGESGIKVPTDAGNYAQRSTYYDEKILNYFEEGGDGYLIWSYTEAGLDPNFHRSEYDFDSTDPTCSTLAKYGLMYSCGLDSSCISGPTSPARPSNTVTPRPSNSPTPRPTASPTPRLVATPTTRPPVTTAPTPTVVSAPATGAVKFNWDKSVQGWKVDSGKVQGVYLSTGRYYRGGGALGMRVNFGNGSWEEAVVRNTYFSTGQNWTGSGSNLTAYVFVPAATAPRTGLSATLFVQRWGWSESGRVNLVPGRWTKINWVNAPLNRIYGVGLKIISQNAPFSGHIYVDHLKVE